MPDILLIKDPGGVLVPATDEARAQVERLKNGEMYSAKITFQRNGKLLRKWIMLLTYGYGIFEERCPGVVVDGVTAKPNFKRFRYDITIMAGFYYVVVNARGEPRREPESVSYKSMSDERFEQLYTATLDVLITEVLNDETMSREKLDEIVNHMLKFA